MPIKLPGLISDSDALARAGCRVVICGYANTITRPHARERRKGLSFDAPNHQRVYGALKRGFLFGLGSFLALAAVAGMIKAFMHGGLTGMVIFACRRTFIRTNFPARDVCLLLAPNSIR